MHNQLKKSTVRIDEVLKVQKQVEAEVTRSYSLRPIKTSTEKSFRLYNPNTKQKQKKQMHFRGLTAHREQKNKASGTFT